jgi:hypothetical protein
MKKTILSILILLNGSAFAASPGSTIALNVQEEVQPAAQAAFFLNSLVKDAFYNVTCNIYNPNRDGVDLRFEMDEKNASGHGKFSLNGSELSNDQGTLNYGDNTVSVNVVSGATDNSIVVKNLNFNSSVKLSNCVARPVTKNLASQKALSGGHFTLYNDTDKTIDIGVGNFVPTNYTVKPHDSKWVFVSKDNR